MAIEYKDPILKAIYKFKVAQGINHRKGLMIAQYGYDRVVMCAINKPVSDRYLVNSCWINIYDPITHQSVELNCFDFTGNMTDIIKGDIDVVLTSLTDNETLGPEVTFKLKAYEVHYCLTGGT